MPRAEAKKMRSRERSRVAPKVTMPAPPAEIRDAMKTVFVSYSTKNPADAALVCSALENAGIRCWIAPRDLLAGTNFADNIEIALGNIKMLVLVLSRQSAKSPWIEGELNTAFSASKPILVFRIDDVELAGSFRLMLGLAPALQKTGDPAADRAALAENARKMLAGEPLELKPLRSIPRWEREAMEAEKAEQSGGNADDFDDDFSDFDSDVPAENPVPAPEESSLFWKIFLAISIFIFISSLVLVAFLQFVPAKVEAEKSVPAESVPVESTRGEATSPDVAIENLPNDKIKKATSGDVASLRADIPADENSVPANPAGDKNVAALTSIKKKSVPEKKIKKNNEKFSSKLENVISENKISAFSEVKLTPLQLQKVDRLKKFSQEIQDREAKNLFDAINEGDLCAAEDALKKGANPDKTFLYKENEKRQTEKYLLEFAIKEDNRDVELIELLLKYGATPYFSFFCLDGDDGCQIAELLCDYGCPVNGENDDDSENLYLLISVKNWWKENEEIGKRVIKLSKIFLSYGADSKMPSKKGESAYDYAKRIGDEEFLKVFDNVKKTKSPTYGKAKIYTIENIPNKKIPAKIGKVYSWQKIFPNGLYQGTASKMPLKNYNKLIEADFVVVYIPEIEEKYYPEQALLLKNLLKSFPRQKIVYVANCQSDSFDVKKIHREYRNKVLLVKDCKLNSYNFLLDGKGRLLYASVGGSGGSKLDQGDIDWRLKPCIEKVLEEAKFKKKLKN